MAVAASDTAPSARTVTRWPLSVTPVLWALFAVYGVVFIYLSWLRYHTFLMHAEDMGNMEQAVWNTAHGHLWPPFQFNNLRIKSGIEASGTTTRLSFHVEPILLLVALPGLIFQSPLNLMVIQTLVVASGVFPAAWLARRYLVAPLAQVAFPLAYLLTPALESANLYEFHAVTLSAALLLWALYFADGGRYRLFALFALLAMGTKEEIGLVVAMMGLWIWWRRRDRTVGLVTAILAVGWSLFCVLVIMRHFGIHHHSSPYCARFNPYLINGRTTDVSAKVVTCSGVAKLWMRYPDQVLSILVMPQKLGFLHRMLVTTGYLSLLSPLTLAISLPSYGIILFSNDVHMYSGLSHYPAELVPILVGSAIIGTAWLSRQARRLRIAPGAVTTVACVWLLVASVANARANGFTPLAASFDLPQDTAHDRIGREILSLIPKDAAVSAGDYLNPHLSDRRNIYLFPDVGDARYVVVDVSRENFPLNPNDEMGFILGPRLLGNGIFGVLRAEDGYILMERRSFNPRLPTTLPPSFYSFVAPAPGTGISHPLVVDFGPSLQLVGYDLERREQVNLRQPDILLTTYWRRIGPVTGPITPAVYLTNGSGAIDVRNTDHPSTDWSPIPAWPLGQTMRVQGVPMTVFTNEDGNVDVDVAVYRPETCQAYPPGSCDLLTDVVHRYRPDVRWTPGHVPMEVVAQGTILKLTQVAARW